MREGACWQANCGQLYLCAHWLEAGAPGERCAERIFIYIPRKHEMDGLPVSAGSSACSMVFLLHARCGEMKGSGQGVGESLQVTGLGFPRWR